MSTNVHQLVLAETTNAPEVQNSVPFMVLGLGRIGAPINAKLKYVFHNFHLR